MGLEELLCRALLTEPPRDRIVMRCALSLSLLRVALNINLLLFCPVLCCVVLCCAVLCCVALCCAVLFCALLLLLCLVAVVAAAADEPLPAEPAGGGHPGLVPPTPPVRPGRAQPLPPLLAGSHTCLCLVRLAFHRAKAKRTPANALEAKGE